MKKHHQEIIDKLNLFYAVAIVLLIFGIFGLALGIWVQFFRPSSPGELMLNKTLFLFSIGFIFSAIIHFQSLSTIKALAEDKNKNA